MAATTTTLTPRAQRLAAALIAAREAAAGAEGTDDGGTCNFDSVFLFAERGLTSKAVEAAAEAAGVTVSRTSGGYWNGWFVFVGERGQAAMRTRMVEAAHKAMTAAGERPTIYYAMD